MKCDAFYGPSETEIGCLQKGKERLDAQKDAREEMGGKCANGGDKGGGGAGKGDWKRPMETNSAPNCLLLAFLILSQITLVC